MEVAERLHWTQIYWVNGATKGGAGVGAPARGEALKLESRRAIYAVQDAPSLGWCHALVIEGPEGMKHSTIFCPYTLQSFRVPKNCAELEHAREPKEWRHDFVVNLVTRHFEEGQRLGLQGMDLDTAAMVLKLLGAPVPTRTLNSAGEDASTKERGGKGAAKGLTKPVKRKGKRGDFLAWFLEGNGSRPVREAMAQFGMTRSNVLSYLFILQKDHGIGYTLTGDLATVAMPEGVTDPFDTKESK